MLRQVGELRVLEVGHEDLRARVQRVDHHLASVGPVISTRRSARSAGARRDLPVALADRLGSRGRKSSVPPASSRAWRSARARSRSGARGSNALVQVGDEVDRVVGEHLAEPFGERSGGLAADLDVPHRVLPFPAAPFPFTPVPSIRPQQLDRVVDARAAARALGVRRDLQRAARVRRDHRLGAGCEQVLGLAPPQLGRAPRAPACCRRRPTRSRSPIPRARRARGRGSSAAASRGCGADALGVGEVAGVVVGGAASPPGCAGPRLVLGQQLGDVAHLRRTPRRARPRPARGAAARVVLHRRAAAGRVDRDEVVALERLDRPLGEFRTSAVAPRVQLQRSAAARRGRRVNLVSSAASTLTIASLTRPKKTR